MKQKNVFIFFLLMVLTLSILIGCSNEQTRSDADVATTAVTDSTAETPTESAESANTESNAGPPADGMMGGMTFLHLSTEHPVCLPQNFSYPANGI